VCAWPATYIKTAEDKVKLISAARAGAITHREFRIGGNSSWETQLQKQPDRF